MGADKKGYRRVCGNVVVLAGNEGVDGQGKEGCDGSYGVDDSNMVKDVVWVERMGEVDGQTRKGTEGRVGD